MRYNYTYLEEFCNINKILLAKDYLNQNINITSFIEGKCLNNECINFFSKSFKSFVKTNGYCLICSTKIGINKNKQTCLEKYGVEHVSKVLEITKKKKQTCLDKYGVEFASQSLEVKNKTKQTCLDKYGVTCSLHDVNINEKSKKTWLDKYGDENYLKTQDFKNKNKKTCLDKYGIEFVSQLQEVKDKKKETCLENYGVEYPSQAQEIKDKIKINNLVKYGTEHTLQVDVFRNKGKETCLEKYGVDNYSKTQEFNDKTKATCLKKYGVEYPSQVPEFKDKIKETCLAKYGVEYSSQYQEIMEKCSKNAYKLKEYTFPSNKIIKCQGYEPFALNDLLQKENINENDIIIGCKNVPIIWYIDDNEKTHRHYVDIFIPSKNLCIEVKSTWTAEKKKDIMFLKQTAAKTLKYNYEIWVYNQKGIRVVKYE